MKKRTERKKKRKRVGPNESNGLVDRLPSMEYRKIQYIGESQVDFSGLS